MKQGPLNVSPAELKVLELIAEGYSAKEVGILLGKASNTVKAQLGAVRLKIGARNTSHAVLIACKQGLL